MSLPINPALDVPRNQYCEDSLILKALTCVPIVGTIATLIIENSLLNKIMESSSPFLSDYSDCSKQRIELIELKNNYKKCAIVRDAISVALVIAAVAAGILMPPFLLCALTFGILVGYNIYRIHQNDEAVTTIKNQSSPAYTPSVTVY